MWLIFSQIRGSLRVVTLLLLHWFQRLIARFLCLTSHQPYWNTYKIISKILSSRLENVLDMVVSCEQSTFIKDCQILDGPLMVNELVEWYKKTQKDDVVEDWFWKSLWYGSWTYMDRIMQFLNFGSKWWCWIRDCLIFARSSILLNGSPTEEFQLHKWLRQGDP